MPQAGVVKTEFFHGILVWVDSIMVLTFVSMKAKTILSIKGFGVAKNSVISIKRKLS